MGIPWGHLDRVSPSSFRASPGISSEIKLLTKQTTQGKASLQDPFGCEGADLCHALRGLVLLSPQNLEFKALNWNEFKTFIFKYLHKKNNPNSASVLGRDPRGKLLILPQR